MMLLIFFLYPFKFINTHSLSFSFLLYIFKIILRSTFAALWYDLASIAVSELWILWILSLLKYAFAFIHYLYFLILRSLFAALWSVSNFYLLVDSALTIHLFVIRFSAVSISELWIMFLLKDNLTTVVYFNFFMLCFPFDALQYDFTVSLIFPFWLIFCLEFSDLWYDFDTISYFSLPTNFTLTDLSIY